MQRQQKKLKVYCEEAKERLTTHWDLDYMTNAQIEAVTASDRSLGTTRHPLRRPMSWAGFSTGSNGC